MIMETASLQFSLVIIFLLALESVHLSISSDPNLIVKNLPGYSGELPFTLEAGYVGLGEDEAVQAYYYFVESERNPDEDPLLLYLTGGPGTTGLYPFLYQFGPLNFNFDIPWTENITFVTNPNRWTRISNIIFVDLPVGSGFSYGKTWEATRCNDSLLVSQSYEFLRKWLADHPRFYSNPLYIAGTSYMGLMTPIVTWEIYEDNERGIQPELNIKGYLITSPLTDKFSDFNSRIEFAHRVALISDGIYESAKENCQGNYIDVRPGNTLCMNSLQRVDECISKINVEQILEPVCNFSAPDPGPACSEYIYDYINHWANDKAVQKALNVREGTIGTWNYKNLSIHYDQKKEDTVAYSYDIFSSLSYHQKLVSKNCRVFIMNADHDMTFPYVGTEKWIKNDLNVTISSPWEPWFVRDQIAGYQMTYTNDQYSLKYTTCKGAGHSIPVYKPEETCVMVLSWLDSSLAYSSDS